MQYHLVRYRSKWSHFVVIITLSIFLGGYLTSCSTDSVSRTAPSSMTLSWQSMHYSVNCGGLPKKFIEAVTLDVGGANWDLAIVLLECNAMDGSGPFAVQSFKVADQGGTASLLQTLMNTSDYWAATGALEVSIQGTVSLPVSGFSSNVRARCCPDIFTTLKWNWDGKQYMEFGTEPNHLNM